MSHKKNKRKNIRGEHLNHFFKDTAAALSLANLFYLKTWQELVFADLEGSFYLKSPSTGDYYAVLLNVLLLSVFIFTLFRTYRKIRPGYLQKLPGLFLFLILLVPLNSFRTLAPALSIARLAELLGEWGLIAGAIIVLLLTASLSVYFHRQFIEGSAVALLVLSPFVLLTFSQAAWALATSNPGESPPSFKANEAVETSHNRVLWLIFDELDQRMTFEERPSDVTTPELDRLREQSLYATQAFSPGEDTITSMPALISGQVVDEARPAGPDELMLTFENEENQVSWSQQPGVFTKTEALGYDAALVGCYLPYERIIGHTVTTCFWQPFGTAGIKRGNNLVQTMKDQALSALSLSSFNNRHHARAVYRSMLEKTERIVANPAYKLILVHMSIPHYPWIYDRHQDDFTLANYDLDEGYFDNLVLVDQTIKRLRRNMEKAGTWEDTHVIVTSDHPWRMELFPAYDREFDPRIPFLLRMAGQEKPLTINSSFNTVITADLILELIKGKLSTPEDIKQWIKKQ